jgi:XTP/dITP diphosphohydrolase
MGRDAGLPPRLILATGNPGKLADLAALVEPLGVQGLPLPPGEAPEETGGSYVDNARIKAVAAARRTGLPALADDSGAELPALDGRPGLHTRRWAEGRGGWSEACLTLVAEVGVGASIRFVSALALAWPDGQVVTGEGTAEGTLVGPRGVSASLHPVFLPLGGVRTYAELTDDERRAQDHRRVAFEQLQAALDSA